MLPEHLKEHAAAAAVDAFDADAVTGGKFERGELTLEIAPAQDRERLRVSEIRSEIRPPEHGHARSTGIPAEPRFEVVYHLHSIERNERLRLKCRLAGRRSGDRFGDGVWRAANWYEREVFDLFGIRFRNHPDLRRILMPDDWEGYPLRKDYPVTGSRV